jgi:hypothetical protein
MPGASPEYTTLEEALLAGALAVVLLGTVGLGLLEMLMGTTHVTQRVPGIGIVAVHTSFSPDVRAAVVALGFLLLAVWACIRVARAIRT